MTIEVRKIAKDLYTGSLTLPDVPSVKAEWITPAPLSAQELVIELQKRGCHPVDIWDAILEQSPELLSSLRQKRTSAQYDGRK
jgi:hypothetical protein